jgi:hypothetical protein
MNVDPTVIQILTWLGGGTVLAILAWFVKLPQRAWNRLVLWATFKHGKLPRRAILFAVRRADWNFGSVGNAPATQLHIMATVTNLTRDVDISIINASFRPSWTRRRPFAFRHPVAEMFNWGEVIPARTVTETTFDGFAEPRIEHEDRPITGTLTLVDQFHNRYRQRITVTPSHSVADRIEGERKKKEASEAPPAAG